METKLHSINPPDCNDKKFIDNRCYPFIVFEGVIDSKVKKISQTFAQRIHAVYSCEPHDPSYIEMIDRSLIKEERALLIAADRALHSKIISYDLLFSPVVVAHYVYEQIVTQSLMEHLPESYLWQIQPYNFICPNLIFYIYTMNYNNIDYNDKHTISYNKERLIKMHNKYLDLLSTEKTSLIRCINVTQVSSSEIIDICIQYLMDADLIDIKGNEQ